MELLHSNIWWSGGMEFLNKGFTYPTCLHLYHKGIRCVDDTWDSTQHNFRIWERTQEKFSLTNMELGDWEELTNKIFGQ